jgi:glycosyltransferase involved in cell wall biosynthesis
VNLRIGFSFVDLALGGAQAFLVQLAQGLSGRGHNLSYFLYARRDDPSHTNPALLSHLQTIASPVRRPRDLLSCDVIQLDGYHSLLRKMPYLLHLDRCVETFHSAYSLRRSGPLYVSHRVAVSRAVQTELKLPSHLIYQGIDLPPAPPDNQRQYDVAILGRVHPVKGHLIFLQACELLYRQRGHLQALILGGFPKAGRYQQQIEAEIARLRAAGLGIHFAGDVSPSEVPAWLAQVKILLVPSQSEGFGRMAMEAMACRTPVVANPVGGLLEIVQEGQTGFFANRDEPASFAEIAGHLLDDLNLLNRLGESGRLYIAEHFSLAAMLDAYEELYSNIAQHQ